MNLNRVAYKEGYKYQLVENCMFEVPFDFAFDIPFARLVNHVLIAFAGYCWDGSSGPTLDGKYDARASLLHDIFYQAMRSGQVPISHRPKVDDYYQQCCLEDGMGKVRAWVRRQGLRTRFARNAALPENERKVIYAP